MALRTFERRPDGPPAPNGLDSLEALRRALAWAMLHPPPVVAFPHQGPHQPAPWLLSESAATRRVTARAGNGDSQSATSADDDARERERLIALVELARSGDKEAFGELYDHYQPVIYRFVYYRVGSIPLAEDLVAEAFLRALRNIGSFQWKGRDFGAWLTTIARNLVTDHFKSGRNRLERTTGDIATLDSPTEGPESDVLRLLTNEELLRALRRLPQDQQDCLVLRFLQGRSIAETAEVLERSAGAVKQLQLRAARNLAGLLPNS